MSSTTSLKHQFALLDQKKNELFSLLDIIDSKAYYQQPSPGSWSIGQVANHVYWSERNSLAYMKKKLSYPDSVPPYHPKSWFGPLLIKLVFLSGYKVKAPASIDMWKIEEVLNPVDLKKKWDDLRKELGAFYDEKEPVFRKHLAFRHPFAGRMTMYQVLIFFNDHFRHHLKQINRIRMKLEKTSSASSA